MCPRQGPRLNQLLFDLQSDPYEQNNLAHSERQMCDFMRLQLLELLTETREPYFDVLIQHGVKPERPVRDVSLNKRGPLSPAWSDLIAPTE